MLKLLPSRKKFVQFAPLAHSDEEVYSWIRESLIPTGRVTVAVEDGKVIGMMALSVGKTTG
jgi:hypothetical protein